MALMPRAAANVSLAQVPLARKLNASECFVDVLMGLPKAMTKEDDDFVYWHTMERCNPCLTSLAGWPTGSIRALIWSPTENKFVPQSIAYPARHQGPTNGQPLEPEDLPPFGKRICPDCGINALPPPNCSLATRGLHTMQRHLSYVTRTWWTGSPTPTCFSNKVEDHRGQGECRGDCDDESRRRLRKKLADC